MRKPVLYLLLLCFFIPLTISMKPKGIKDFVRFEENLLVSIYEVTNDEYNIFLNEMKQDGNSAGLMKLKPDTTLWVTKFPGSHNQPLANVYHTHPAYLQYPIVNISKEAMEAYCGWKTVNYNENPKREYKKVVYRLPSEREWMVFSAPLPDHKLPWYGSLPYKKAKKDELEYFCNIKYNDFSRKSGVSYIEDGALYTSRVGSYLANTLGIYDIIGNVAEMTSDGTIKGGSWDNFLEECTVEKAQEFSAPDPRVGFRLVMEVVER